jgi:Ca2+-binding EF-hand superfamily protein
MQHNKSIGECFDLIDTDNSQTISFEELRRAVNRF